MSNGTAVAGGVIAHSSLSLSVDPSVWATGGGSVTLDRRGGTGNTYCISLVSTLLSWVIISQVGIENPEVLIGCHEGESSQRCFTVTATSAEPGGACVMQQYSSSRARKTLCGGT